MPGNTYGDKCGTSMAAPVVSGISALLIQQYHTTFSQDPLPSTVKALLIHTAVDLDDGTSWYNPGPDYASGYGRVDAKAAVDAIVAQEVQESQVSHSQTITHAIELSETTSYLKVTLAWDDPPAAELADPTLINNLDLELVEPNGTTVHRPWVLDAANPSNDATTGVDSVNNVEQVYVTDPITGTWTVRVKGTVVPQGPQRYSLAGSASAGSSSGSTIYLPAVLKNYTAPTTIVSENFEGSFPGSWAVSDDQSGYGEYYWGKRNCRAYEGSYSGWGVGGGANGSALSCGSNYPDNTNSWMVYGPFSLADATAADLTFKLWLYTEQSYDHVCRYASTNGVNFHGTCTSGNSSGWIDRTLDLTNVPTLGDLAGQPNVWVALVFDSREVM